MLTETVWRGLGGDPALLDSLAVEGRDAWLGGPFAVDELAVGSVAAALLAAVELAEARGVGRPAIGLSAENVALSFRSERHLLVGGRPAWAGFAALSRFVRCADGGWARTHGSYPHHAAALGRALAIEVGGDQHRAAVELEHAARSLTALELEEAVIAAGGCAAALRTPSEWASHPAGRAVAGTPLVAVDRELARSAGRGLPPLSDAARPCRGVRVLDLTRVIAGPVAGRTLAALGAEVLRLDPPQLPEIPEQHLDTGAGKRSALLDLADVERREALLAGADIVLVAYRPGALARFGLDGPSLAQRHPHLVQASLSAWGSEGPWADRRGFDSLVQVASGIAAACAAADGTPGVLPAQALDHASGHLMAAAALRALAARARGEPFAPAHLALARTARELLEAPSPDSAATSATGAADPDRHRVTFGEVSPIAPPGTLDGVPLRWAHGPRPFGGDPPVWRDESSSQKVTTVPTAGCTNASGSARASS
jgi:crotonobetainyl-CoA:carnitine CoA-transferase CaiB-like acyl-CoA transferase